MNPTQSSLAFMSYPGLTTRGENKKANRTCVQNICQFFVKRMELERRGFLLSVILIVSVAPLLCRLLLIKPARGQPISLVNTSVEILPRKPKQHKTTWCGLIYRDSFNQSHASLYINYYFGTVYSPTTLYTSTPPPYAFMA
jgi:hypothetical protein